MRSYPYLELTSNNKMWWFYFKIEQKTETDKVTKIEILELYSEDKYTFFLAVALYTALDNNLSPLNGYGVLYAQQAF